MRAGYLTKDEKIQKRIEKECVWHTVFAWFPVTIVKDGIHHKVWLEKVGCKKRVYWFGDMFDRHRHIGDPIYCFHEDLLFNILKDPDITDNTIPLP